MFKLILLILKNKTYFATKFLKVLQQKIFIKCNKPACYVWSRTTFKKIHIQYRLTKSDSSLFTIHFPRLRIMRPSVVYPSPKQFNPQPCLQVPIFIASRVCGINNTWASRPRRLFGFYCHNFWFYTPKRGCQGLKLSTIVGYPPRILKGL